MDLTGYRKYQEWERQQEIKRREFWDKWIRGFGWCVIVAVVGIPAGGLFVLTIYFLMKVTFR